MKNYFCNNKIYCTSYVQDTFDSYILFLSQSGAIQNISHYSDFRQPCISKTAGYRKKWTQI